MSYIAPLKAEQDPALQAWLAPSRNILASPTASAVKSVPAEYAGRLAQKPTRTGSSTGQVILTGDYDQADDATVRVRIQAGGSTPRVTTPAFSGVGSGSIAMGSISASDGAYTLTLKSLGVDTKTATMPLWGGSLYSRLVGAAGNAITITVDPANTSGSSGAITRTATGAALLDQISAGTTELVGQRWNLIGARSNGRLNESGYIDLAVNPRLAFGYSGIILRQYVLDRGGNTVFLFDREIPQTVDAGTRVFAITGAYEVVITDGSTTETYSDIVTRYDLLSAITGSALVQWRDGVLSDDRSPGGLGSMEMDLRTASYCESVSVESQRRPLVEVLSSLTVDATADTQAVVAEYYAADEAEPDRWRVLGTSDGDLGTAYAGKPFTSPVANFTIAQQPLISTGVIRSVSLVSQSISAGSADLRAWIVGPEATPKDFVFTYETRPTDVDTDYFLDGLLDPNCVGGGEIEGEATAVVAIDADYKANLGDLLSWQNTALSNNVTLDADTDQIIMNATDVDLVERLVVVFREALNTIIAGTTAGAVRTAAIADWDSARAAMEAELAPITGTLRYYSATVQTWGVSPTILPGMTYRGSEATAGHDHVYVVVSGALDVASGSATEPTWTTGGGLITHEGVTYKDMGLMSLEGAIGSQYFYEGAVQYMNQHTRRGEVEYYVSKWERTLREAIREADIDPFDLANTAVTGCWRDYDEQGWWAVNGGEYLAMFTNRNWYTVQRVYDSDANAWRYRNTNELALQVEITGTDGAAPAPAAGDTFTIRITGTGDNRVFQQGDKITINVIGAEPADLSGGVTGTDTHTWSVSGPAGPLADYAVVAGAETPYATGGLAFTIYRGQIANAIGDQWSFEALRRRYEVSTNDGGSYSAPADIPASGAVTVIGSLTATFQFGTFDAGDEWRWFVSQPYRATNPTASNGLMWRPGASTADIEYDLGGATASTVVSVLATAPVLVEYLDAPGGSVIGSATIDNPGRVGYALMSGNPAAVKISATTFAADSGGIVYAWAGVPLRLEGEPASMTVRPAMAMERGQGLNPAARRIARGYAADIEYSIDSGSPHPLSDSDRTALVDLYEELKAAGDRPFGFIPNVNRPLAFLSRWTDDEIAFINELADNADIGIETLNAATVRLEPYYVVTA